MRPHPPPFWIRLLIVLAVIIVGMILARRASGQPSATGTVEVDLGPALAPLLSADDQLRADQADLKLQLETHTHATPPDPTDPQPPDPIDPPPADPPGPGDPSPYALGLGPVEYWARQWAFSDLILISDAWRDNGTAYIYTTGHPPAGDYALTWTGSGSIRATLGVTVTRETPNRVELRIHPDAQEIELKRTGSVDDVHLRPAGWAVGDSRFNPVFLERIRPFRALRFMDWQRINGSRVKRWSDRTLPTDRQSTSSGVALQHMIALCNELRTDPWFCMPHLANDDYVRRFATKVRDDLHGGARVYIEYSNEIWNEGFSQTDYLADQGGGIRTEGYFQAWAQEARRDFEIWRQVFAGQEDRLVRVLGVHLQNAWIAEKLIARMGPDTFDALSPSAYFGLSSRQVREMPAGVTVDDLVDLLKGNIDGDNTVWYQQHADQAALQGVDLISYEGGQHVTPNGQTLSWARVMLELQRDPRIGDLYRRNLEKFRAAGGLWIAAYHDVSRPDLKWGHFGALEYQDQPAADAPKYRAVTEAP